MNSTIKPKPCPECGSKFHSAMWHKPRKPIETTKPLERRQKYLARQAVKKSGKHYELWIATRNRWIDENMKPDKRVPCHYCGKELSWASVSLDHKIPRSRAPELRYDFSNLVPCCHKCNGLKGSIDHDSYEHVCHT